MRLVCPHCYTPLELPGFSGKEILCPSCGSSFRLAGDSTTSEGPEVGRKIGRFEILAVVGQGAFGTVYKAYDPELDREVALKVPRAGCLAGAAELDRFLREARSVAQLRHPTIVPVYEVGQKDDLPYLVSEFVHGLTLSDRLTDRPPPFCEAAELVAALADGLQYAHEMGVVHRDVKPSNILLDANGRPHLMDFGLAARAGEVTMTLDGQVLGTPAYMSPEQARGESHQVVGRSDIYSLGVILYRLLTGELPFRGNARMLLHHVLHSEPRAPRSLNDKVPRDLENVCLKAMAKDPTRRYPTARDLADDLRRFLKGEPVRARPVGNAERLVRWCRRNPALAAAVGAAAFLLGAIAVTSTVMALLLDRARWDSDKARQQAEALERQGRGRLAALYAGNGARLLEEGDLPGSLLWFTEALAQEEDDPIRAATHRLRLSLVLRQCHRLTQMWFHERDVTCVAFGPDGRQLATGCADGTARVWDASTGLAATPSLRAATKRDGLVQRVAFSPDGGRLLATAAHVRRPKDSDLTYFDKVAGEARVWDIASGREVMAPLAYTGMIQQAGFTNDGCRIFLASDNQAQVVELATGKPAFPAREIFGGVLGSAAISPDGRYAIDQIAAMDPHLRLIDLTTGHSLKPDLKETFQSCPAFSPDGCRVAVALQQGEARHSGERCAAQILDVATEKSVTPLMPLGGASISRLAFSSDGRRLLTMSGSMSLDPKAARLNSQDAELRTWDAGTGAAISPPVRVGGTTTYTAFTPDGHRFVTASVMPGGEGQARLWDAVTGQPVSPLFRHASRINHAAIGPEGRRIVTAGSDHVARLWDAAGGPTIVPLDTPRPPQQAWFSPDGSRLAVAQARTVRVYDSTTGEALTAPLAHPGIVFRTAFAPDNRLLATASAEREPVDYFFLTGKFDKLAQIEPKHNEVRVWDCQTGRLVAPALAFGRPVVRLAFAPGGHLLATASGREVFDRPTDIQIWNTATGQRVAGPWQHTGEISQLYFTADGERLFSSSIYFGLATVESPDQPDQGREFRAEICIRNIARGALLFPPLQYPAESNAMACLSADGRLLATGDVSQLRLWDGFAGKGALADFKVPEAVPAAFSQDGKQLLSIGRWDGKVRVWDTTTGMPVTLPFEHREYVDDAVFSSDGRHVITLSGYPGSRPMTIRVWDVATGLPVSPPLRYAPYEYAVDAQGFARLVLAARGQRLLTRDADGGLVATDLSVEGRPLEDLRAVAQLMTGLQLDATGSPTAVDEAALRALWERQRADHPGDFACSPEILRRWHWTRVHECESTKRWDEALIHLDQLLAQRIAPVALLARRARAEAAQKHWDQAAADYTRAIALSPDEPDLWADRAECHAQAGAWDGAGADYAKALELDPGDGALGYKYALVCLARHDTAAYRAACADLVKRCGQDPLARGQVAWACVVAPGALENLDRVVHLAEEERVLRDGSPESLWLLAAALYRDKRFQAAVQRLDEAQKTPLALPPGKGLPLLPCPAHPGTPQTAGSIPASIPFGWLLRAMAHQRLGNAAESRRCLDEARRRLDQGVASSLSWDARLQYQLLRGEAEALIRDRGEAKR